jgi:hypothetical protein
MIINFSGKILFANGAPVPGVEVRVFDQDADLKQDDDLTTASGVSDSQGLFTVTYQPARYLDISPGDTSRTTTQPFNTRLPHLQDLADLYLPYLRFEYTLLGKPRQHQAWLVPFQTEFHLPESSPVHFIPSQHGFHFPNRFSGYFMPISVPASLLPKKVPPSYGLCGGMSSAALDFILGGRPIPECTEIPRNGSRLQRYLFHRQMDTMGALGSTLIKVAQWTTLPDDTPHGLQRLTFTEFSRIRQRLDDQNPVVIGLIFVHANTAAELARLIFNNHQVLAHSYDQSTPLDYTLHVYDPNYPGRDDVVIQIRQAQLTLAGGREPLFGLECVQMIGGKVKPVRGFFAMPYTPVEPPAKL